MKERKRLIKRGHEAEPEQVKEHEVPKKLSVEERIRRIEETLVRYGLSLKEE